jgi:RNA polymerase sigma factor (sigma-70 family)
MMPQAQRSSRWEDLSLAQRCALNPIDEDAWRTLWGRYHVLIAWRIMQVVPPGLFGEVDDIAQETMLKFRRSASRYNPMQSSLATFLTTIAVSVAKDWKRSRRRAPAGVELVESEGAGKTELELLPEALIDEGNRRVQEIANARKRLVFQAFLKLKTPEEVRDELGIPESTAYRLYGKFEEWARTLAASLPTGSPVSGRIFSDQ